MKPRITSTRSLRYLSADYRNAYRSPLEITCINCHKLSKGNERRYISAIALGRRISVSHPAVSLLISRRLLAFPASFIAGQRRALAAVQFGIYVSKLE